MLIRSFIGVTLAFALILAAGCAKDSGPAKPDTPIGKALATPGAVVLDVRSKAEWHQGHVPGAIHLPVQEIESVASKIPDKDTQIIVHCAAGVRSAHAAKVMAKLGYTRVFDAKTPDAVARAKGVSLER
jgi:rhodanese-related sulfurtransferase